MVFLLWGSNARSKKPLIDRAKHLVLEAPHPSPLSAFAGFFGCKHFSKANALLSVENGTLSLSVSVVRYSFCGVLRFFPASSRLISGESFSKSTLITDEVKKTFKDLTDLAPLHNPANLMGVEAVEKVLP